MNLTEDIRKSLLESEPDYVVWCSNSISSESDPVIKKFKSAPYLLRGDLQTGEGFISVYAAGGKV
jgi:hypothetical protein